jgi:hypothetical protein
MRQQKFFKGWGLLRSEVGLTSKDKSRVSRDLSGVGLTFNQLFAAPFITNHERKAPRRLYMM